MKGSLFRLFGVSAASLLLACSLTACTGSATDDKEESPEPQESAGMSEPEERPEGTGEKPGDPIPDGQIAEQSFEVELEGWGTVTFASFQPLPNEDADRGQEAGNPEEGGQDLSADARFMLLSGDCVVYNFPGKTPDSVLSGVYSFREVLAVAFRDYNGDGRTDILILLKYDNPADDSFFHLVRAYTQEEGEKEFFIDGGLSDYLSASYGKGYAESMSGVYEGIAAYSGLYEACTDISAFEVERYARKVRKLILEGDWESLAGECAYPLMVDGREYEDKEALLAANLLQNPGQDFLRAVEQETCGNLFCSWQGIMLGNGEIWIQGAAGEDMSSRGLKITALNGLN